MLGSKKFEIHAQIGTGDRHVLSANRQAWISPEARYTFLHARLDSREEADNIMHIFRACGHPLSVVEVRDFSAFDAKALNDWYEEEFGYRPQEDDPTLTTEHLRLLCEDMAVSE